MELRDYLRGLRRHVLAILLMTAVGAAVAFGWYSVQTPVYEATAIGVVQTRAIVDPAAENLAPNPAYDTFARAKLPTYIDMATWKIVADRTIDQLDLDITANQAVERIEVVNPTDTNSIRITATGGSPEEAAALAEEWLSSLAFAIDSVEGDGTEGSAPINLTTYESAALSDSPIFPSLTTALTVGALVGLGAGVAFALMRTASDQRIRGAADVEARTDLPVVGSIPVASVAAGTRLLDASTAGAKGSGFAVSEALRALRTNLQFMDVDNPPRVIVVTSPLPGDGKSTIACNLALTLAEGGKTVVLVDGDLRRSTVAETMGLPGGAGLTDVLAGRVGIAEVLQRTARWPNMFVLTAGSTPPNPSEVLGSERMHKLVQDLAKHATVIIDAPPLLPVTDGAVLTRQADGAVLVVSVGKTTYELLDKAVDTLAKAGGRALGVVLNRVPLRGAEASSYSYEYRREYGAKTTGDQVKASDGARPEDDAPAGLTVDEILGAASGDAAEDYAPRQRARRP
jgi:capsular exopolysaccharide synthesis family protein